MSHTPGPWTVGEDGIDGCWFVPEVGVVDCCHGLGIADEGNAYLIAAAPELLAACIEFVRKCDCGEARSTRSYAEMKAAIAKAEGR